MRTLLFLMLALTGCGTQTHDPTELRTTTAALDSDGDGVDDEFDNCPDVAGDTWTLGYEVGTRSPWRGCRVSTAWETANCLSRA